jgi:hypothetical protein
VPWRSSSFPRRRSPTGRREDLLRLEAARWRGVEDGLDGLSGEQLERPGLNADGWSIKDLLWHLAVWHEEASRVLLKRARDVDDAALEPGWVDRVNADGLAHGRGMDLDRVREVGRVRRARMLAAFGALDDAPAAAQEWFEESGTIHYAEHEDDLVRWSETLRSQG